MHEEIASWLRGLGLGPPFVEPVIVGGGLAGMALAGLLAYVIGKRLLVRVVTTLAARTKVKWDDQLVKRGVFGAVANFAPALLVYLVAPMVLAGHPTASAIVDRAATIAMIIIGAVAVNSLLNALSDIFQSHDHTRQLPVKALLQVGKVVLYCVGSIVVLAVLLDKTPLYLLSGLGAITAVLLIVFRDPILGLVAGIQLSANKMVAVGDWLEMPTHSADGDVIDIALTTVKIRNFDKTITTIPTYDLISKPFKNWRGMTESGGRRIKRPIAIDLGSVSFLDEAELERLGRIQLIADYVAELRAEIASFNAKHAVDPASSVNGRRMTNLGTFRAYVRAYLRAHPQIHHEGMTFLVRQLPPTPHGLPIELYVFTTTTVWSEYEDIQADIFDHLLAALPEFGLRAYQEPSGADMRVGLSQGR